MRFLSIYKSVETVAGDGECEVRQLYVPGDFDAPCAGVEAVAHA